MEEMYQAVLQANFEDKKLTSSAECNVIWSKEQSQTILKVV